MTAATAVSPPAKRPAKLNAKQAETIALAENAVLKAKAALEQAEEDRELVRARYLDRIPFSDDPEEAAKGVRKDKVGAYKIRVSPVAGRESFSLRRFVDLGHKVTAQMREAMKLGDPYDRWTVTPVKGPARPGSVERS